ncbi:6409_t:CDS:1, partial [Diversispora eburnea]
FDIRIAESFKTTSEVLSLFSGTIIIGSFFLVILGLYVLLIEWIQSITKSHISTKRLSWEIKLVRIPTYLSPTFSIYGIIGMLRLYNNASINYDNSNEGSTWMLISTLGFLILTFIYICCVTYFAFMYGEKPIKGQLKAFVLYISGALLSIELIYRIMVDMSNATDSINRYEWIFYLFEMIPEVTLLIILGGFILNEWFYKDEDHVTAKTGSSSTV